jgi:hypothetical protein
MNWNDPSEVYANLGWVEEGEGAESGHRRHRATSETQIYH